MSATTIPGLSSSASSAFDGASSSSRSGRSSQPAPPTPITGAKMRPLTGCRRCASTSTPATITSATLTAITRICYPLRFSQWRLPHDQRPRPTPNALPKSITKASRIAWEPLKRVRARPDDVRAWFDGRHPIVVVEDERRDRRVCLDVELPRARMLRGHRGILGLRRAQRRAAAAPAPWRCAR